MAKKLKSFQKEGVKFLFKLWQSKRGGILGDGVNFSFLGILTH